MRHATAAEAHGRKGPSPTRGARVAGGGGSGNGLRGHAGAGKNNACSPRDSVQHVRLTRAPCEIRLSCKTINRVRNAPGRGFLPPPGPRLDSKPVTAPTSFRATAWCSSETPSGKLPEPHCTRVKVLNSKARNHTMSQITHARACAPHAHRHPLPVRRVAGGHNRRGDFVDAVAGLPSQSHGEGRRRVVLLL